MPLVIDLAQQWRAELLRGEQHALDLMAQQWLAVEKEMQTAIRATAEQAAQEGWTTATLSRQRRYLALMTQTKAQLDRFGSATAVQLDGRRRDAVTKAASHAVQAIRIAVSDGQVGIAFDRLPVGATERMAALIAQGPVQALLDDAAGAGADAMRRELVTGVALGRSPTDIARRMTRQGLGVTFTRAATIARTETLRAYRTATLDAYRTSGVVTGYRRLADHSQRTCIGCLFADGRLYGLDEAFDQHPNCRCSLTPLVANVPLTDFETGQQWFARQPDDVQRAMLGQERFDLWRAGRVTLDDLVKRTEHDVWGGALVPRPVAELGGVRRSVPVAPPRPVSPRATMPVQAAPVQVPPELTTEDRLRAAVQSAERRIYTLRTHEEGYLFDDAGNLILHKGGGADYVEFDDDEIKLFRGKILTHNHPLTAEGSSFSPEDVALSAQHGLAEVRAVGGRYVHSLRMEGLDWGDIEPHFQQAYADVRVDFMARIRRDDITVEYAELNHWHEVWTRVGNAVGSDKWRYVRMEHGYANP